MSVLCVIPARYQSSRLPGKPLIDLGGKSMIHRVCEAVQAAGCFDEIIVATDDERIHDHVRSIGFGCEMTDSGHVSGTDRCAEVASRHEEFDYIVNVQGDEPGIESDLLNQVVDELKFGDHQGIVTAIAPLDVSEITDPDRVKVVLNWANYALIFSRSPVPYRRNENPAPDHFRHIGIYGFRIGLLPKLTEYPICELEQIESLEQLRWLYYGHQVKCVAGDWKGRGIDSPKDVESYLRDSDH